MDRPYGPEGCGLPCGVKVQMVQRVVDCPGAMLIKSALRDLPFLSPVPHNEEPEPPSTGKQKPCRGLLNRALV